jgi:hypothetical protein
MGEEYRSVSILYLWKTPRRRTVGLSNIIMTLPEGELYKEESVHGLLKMVCVTWSYC